MIKRQQYELTLYRNARLVGENLGLSNLTFNESRWDDALNLATEDSIEEEIGTGRTLSRDEALQSAKDWKASFPDARGQIVNRVISGNQAAGEIVWEGTNRGELMGMPATGRAVRVQASVFLQERDGKIARVRHYIDVAGMMAQLGVTPGAGQPQMASAG